MVKRVRSLGSICKTFWLVIYGIVNLFAEMEYIDELERGETQRCERAHLLLSQLCGLSFTRFHEVLK